MSDTIDVLARSILTLELTDEQRQQIMAATNQNVATLNLDLASSVSAFYRGANSNLNPFPSDHEQPHFCRDFILTGHLPAAKIINKDTRLTVFGSCFAQDFLIHLCRLNLKVVENPPWQALPAAYANGRDRHHYRLRRFGKDKYIARMGEGNVNVYSFLQQLTWALDGEAPPENLWPGFDPEHFGYDEHSLKLTRRVFLNTEVFIVTLGLAEILYDEVTGRTFWRAMPRKDFDPSRHKFRVCTFAETRQALERIHTTIAKYLPSARIVFVVTPLPLNATCRPISAITATWASKSILLAALDEYLRGLGGEARERVHYFPAFEIINELFAHRFVEDGVHLPDFVTTALMKIFEAYYCDFGLSPEDAELALREARIRSAAMTASLHR